MIFTKMETLQFCQPYAVNNLKNYVDTYIRAYVHTYIHTKLFYISTTIYSKVIKFVTNGQWIFN